LNIWSILSSAVASHGERIAVEDGEWRFTYDDVEARAAGLARFLRTRGISRGDRIAILEVNSHAFLEAYYAAAGIGAILCPLNYRLSAREIGFILNDSGARWLLASSDFADLVRASTSEPSPLEGMVWIGGTPGETRGLESHEYEQALGTRIGTFEPAPVDQDAVAHLYYTSGTTGRPKGVMLTHRNVCVHSHTAIQELELANSDVWGHIAPMFHLADAWASFAITWVGGRHVMVPHFEAEAVLKEIGERGITLSNLIPTMLNLMTKHPRAGEYDYSSLRVILSGGAPIAPEVVRRIMEVLGCEYIQTYGMTETSPYLTLSILKDHLRKLPAEQRLAYQAKTGRPFAGVELKVVDDDGSPVVPDEQQVGEIWVRGETITPGYWNRPEETREAFCDGWLKTGDLAVLDPEGYVNIVDRKKDMIITGGENVYSTEVENVLYAHPEVLEAAVFGVPDEKWGESVEAAIVPRDGAVSSAVDIIRFCRERLAAYKAPKSIDFLSALPRTGSGKIYKKALRDGQDGDEEFS
jgi:acyl-CoA synthetase (AMP-forming)/AMP-acid ligase II